MAQPATRRISRTALQYVTDLNGNYNVDETTVQGYIYLYMSEDDYNSGVLDNNEMTISCVKTDQAGNITGVLGETSVTSNPRRVNPSSTGNAFMVEVIPVYFNRRKVVYNVQFIDVQFLQVPQEMQAFYAGYVDIHYF